MLKPTLRTPRFFSNQDKPVSSDWYPCKDFYIHEELFKYGIIAIKNKKFPETISCDSFPMNGRKFCLQINSSKESSQAQKAHQLLSKLVTTNVTINKKFCITNTSRRDEIFSPLILNNEVGLYVYLWLSTTDSKFIKNTTSFEGFKRFVTAGCLFGSSLKGFDDKNMAMFPLIKHNIQFHPGQKITAISLGEFSPYEDVLFHDLEKTACLIDSFSVKGEQKQLHYHLPYHDYVLYGIELYIRGRMTYEALNDLIATIYKRKEEHVDKINKICERHQIKVTIESPFENLFSDANDCEAILQKLNIPTEHDTVDAELIDKLEKEKELVKVCLEYLKSNSHKIEHTKIWGDFIKKTGENNINTLEDLFKIANAVMIGLSAMGTEKNTTCSLLPVSEKQIQISYSKCVDNTYPSIVNLTFLDPLFTYGLGNNGLVFYCSGYETTLSELIKKTYVLNDAQQNIVSQTKNHPDRLIKVETAIKKREERESVTTISPNMLMIDSNSQLGILFLQFAQTVIGDNCSLEKTNDLGINTKIFATQVNHSICAFGTTMEQPSSLEDLQKMLDRPPISNRGFI